MAYIFTIILSQNWCQQKWLVSWVFRMRYKHCVMLQTIFGAIVLGSYAGDFVSNLWELWIEKIRKFGHFSNQFYLTMLQDSICFLQNYRIFQKCFGPIATFCHRTGHDARKPNYVLCMLHTVGFNQQLHLMSFFFWPFL